MSSNPDQIVQQMQCDFQNLIAYVRDAEARTRTAAEVECTLFRRLLALGLHLLQLFLTLCQNDLLSSQRISKKDK